ncbi:MAG: alpha/beta hydrolase fold domain-containing protein [Bacteroidetes bacterium]|nr:alpha/beta hydrolase fold domain-containing protein [Bacteroidota bacterium]
MKIHPTEYLFFPLNKKRIARLSCQLIVAIFLMFQSNIVLGQLLVDNFDYPAGTSLTAAPTPGYTLQGTGTVPLNVSSEGLFYPGYMGSGVGNAAQFVGPADGMDPFKPFVTSALTTGSVYVSCLVKITSATTAGEYFLANKIDASSSGTASVVRARVYVKSDGAGGISFGIAKGTTPPAAGWTAFSYQLNTTYLLVYKYTFVAGTTNDNVDLFINPALGVPEPAPTISYADFSTTDAAGMKSVLLTQRTNGPSALVDGLRVATTWTDAVAYDNAAPVATFIPANGAIAVLRTVQPTITFNEPIFKTDGTPVTNADLSSLVSLKTTNASGTSVPFSAVINDSRTVITVTPSSQLDYSQLYYLAVGPVKDGAGNQSSTQSSLFTTVANALSTDATLSDLKVDGTTINGFSSSILTYSRELPFGTLVIPTVTATPNFGLATVNITPTGSLPGTTSITVTAQDGTTQMTYTVSFTLAPPSNDANLNNLRWLPASGSQSIMVTGFTPSITNYSTVVPSEVTDVLMVASVANSGATTTITPPTNLNGTLVERTGTVVVTAQDGITTKTYSIVFSVPTGLSYHFKEGFANFPPANWSYSGNISNSTANGVGIFTAGLSCPKFKWTAPLDGGILVTPPCNSAGILGFYVRVLDNDTSHHLHLYVEKSLDGGSSWATLATDPAPMNGSTAIWNQVFVNINDDSQNILLRLRCVANTGTNSQGLFYIDDMSLTMNTANDASLSDLAVNGSTVSGFAPAILSYDVSLPAGTTSIPTISATPSQPASTVSITNPSGLPGTASILVTAPNGIATATYSINYSVILAAPYNLTAATSGSNQVNLSWSDNNSNELGFKIERKPNNGLFALVGTTGASTTVATDQVTLLSPSNFVAANRFANVTVNSGIKFADVINYQGTPTSLYLDEYEPTGDNTLGRPVIIWIHGGGFRTGSYRTQGYIVDYCTRFAKRGYVCISIDYRLRDGSSMPTQASEFPALQDAARDANAAINWIKANAAAYHVDPNLIFIAGGSAGGRTAQTVCQFDGPDPTAQYPPENMYLTTPWDKSGLIANATLWGGLEPEMRGWVYPYLQPTDIPTILVHGDADVTILPQNSIDLYDTLTATGITSELHIIPGATHSCLGHETEISEWVAVFFAQEWTKVNAKFSSYTYRVCAYNAGGNSPYSNEATASFTKSLNVKLYLEGLYADAGVMNQAKGTSGPQFGAGIADQVTIELHQSAAPYDLAYTFSNINLSTVGNLLINTIPGSITGSYYIVVKHRNSVETWSSNPVNFGLAGPVSFDFSTSISQAYGNNLRLVGSICLIYGGDAYHDGSVDGSDMAVIDNASTSLLHGYFAEDVNGDGVVDGSDMALIDNNSTALVHIQRP